MPRHDLPYVEPDPGGVWRIIEGLPPKWRAALVIVMCFGPMAGTTAFFMAQSAGWIRSPILENNIMLMTIKSNLETAVASMKAEVAQSHQQDENVVRLLWATCRNVAKSDFDRTQCDNYWKR